MSRLAGILFFIFLTVSSKAQDTLKKVSFNIGAEFWSTFVPYPYNPDINRPKYLENSNSFDSRDTLKDSPLKHGAYYVAVKTITSFTPGLKLTVNLYGEHRGISYGIYNRNNIVVYPVFILQVKDSIEFLKHKFIIEGKAGDLLDKRLDEGLFIYNIDVQGGEGSITSGKWKASAAWYGDLFNGIGLNIDDVQAFSLNRSFGKQSNTNAGVAVYALAPPFARLTDYLYYSVYFRHRYANANIYAQAALQGENHKGGFYSRGLKPQSAFVVGGNITYSKGKWSGTTTAEARYYGSSVNLFRRDYEVRYRNPNGNLYANTIGEYLYPLRKYDTPFSQWAVFTECFICDIWGASLLGNINYAVSKKSTATLEYDFNYIAAAENKVYNRTGNTSKILYTFYTAGYYYTPLNNCKIGLIITNRGMNLNLNYPTLQQFTHPYIGFKIRCTI